MLKASGDEYHLKYSLTIMQFIYDVSNMIMLAFYLSSFEQFELTQVPSENVAMMIYSLALLLKKHVFTRYS